MEHLLHEILVRNNIQVQILKEFCLKEKYPCFISYHCDNVYVAEKTLRIEEQPDKQNAFFVQFIRRERPIYIAS